MTIKNVKRKPFSVTDPQNTSNCPTIPATITLKKTGL